MTATASAASVNSMTSDGFCSGASTLISVVSKTNLVTAIISSKFCESLTVTNTKLNKNSSGNEVGASNAFLGENTTSKCILRITDNIDASSRIGITSNTSDKTL